MKLIYRADQVHNPLQILRQAGYQHFVDPVTKKESYVLRLSSAFYPRFHLYLHQEDDTWEFDLHLDQKKPTYAGSNAHGGEYDGPTVQKELDRIAGWINHASGAILTPLPQSSKKPQEQPQKKEEKKRDLFKGIFG